MKRGLIEWDKGELSEEEFLVRIERTRSLMRAKGLDVISVYGDACQSGNLSYLTNFFPYADTGIFTLPVSGAPKLFTTHAYRNIPWFNTITWIKDIVCTDNMGRELVNHLLSIDLVHRAIGLAHTRTFPYPIYETLREKIECDLIDLTREFEKMRAIKSATELKFTREAAKIAAESCQRLKEVFRPGLTGYELAAEVELKARQSGAQDLFFSIQPDSAPSGLTQPVSQAIQKSCGVEIGVEFKGYWAKLGRTLFCDNQPEKNKKRNGEFLQRYKRATSELNEGQSLKEFSQKINDHLVKMSGIEEVRIYLDPGLEPYWDTHLRHDGIVQKNMVLYVKTDIKFMDNLMLTVSDTYTTQNTGPLLLTEF
jgi:Xaa-Pro aminopeptidase